MRRLVLAAVAGTALLTAAAPSSAVDVVSVRRGDGYTAVGTRLGTQPLLGVTVYDSGRACVGFSKQIPVCAGPLG